MSIKYTPIENKPAYEIMCRNGYITHYHINVVYIGGEIKLSQVNNIEYSDYLFN